MPKIAVLDNLHLLPDAQEQIQDLSSEPVVFPSETVLPSPEEIISRTNDADIVLVSPQTEISSNYLEAAPTVKYIGLCGTSMASIDRDGVAERGITLSNVTDYGDEPTAEFIFMQLTQLLRGTGDYQWQDNPRELMGKSMGIVGLGAVGQSVANLALSYKMDVSYAGPNSKTEWDSRGLKHKEIADLLATNQIIVLSGPSNLKVINESDFERIRPNSILVQASMGNVFDQSAFLKWIAIKDNFAVFDYAAGEENFQSYHQLPRVIFPKIIAGHTLETRQRLGDKVLANLVSYLKEQDDYQP